MSALYGKGHQIHIKSYYLLGVYASMVIKIFDRLYPIDKILKVELSA